MDTKDINIDEIIEVLGLKPLSKEGGLFTQTYISEEKTPPSALPERYANGTRPFGTAILYLLTSDPDSFSAFHCLLTDEIYHFYLGDAVEMTLLHPDGGSRQVVLGQDILHGQHVQFVVPHGVWQGCKLIPGGRFALMGTTMAPGFEWDDFEEGKREALSLLYPGEKEIIASLTRE
jgi:uncharacterized protein